MDPISIVTLSGGVAKLCYQIATTLFIFARDTNDVEDSLNTFATEISGFSLTLQAVTTTLNDPLLGFDKIWQNEDPNLDVWRALGGSIENLKKYLDKLRSTLHAITRHGADKTLLDQAVMAFELRLKKESVDNLRSVLRTHQLSLNTALVMVQLYAQARLPNQKQPDLRPNIRRLKLMAEELPPSSSVCTSGTADKWDMMNNIEHLKRVSRAVISNASEKAESSIGSECGTPFDPDRIQQWLQLSKIAEVAPLEHAVSDKMSSEATKAARLTHGPSQSEVSSWVGNDITKQVNGNHFSKQQSSGADRPLKSSKQVILTRRKFERSISDSFIQRRGILSPVSEHQDKSRPRNQHYFESDIEEKVPETYPADVVIREQFETIPFPTSRPFPADQHSAASPAEPTAPSCLTQPPIDAAPIDQSKNRTVTISDTADAEKAAVASYRRVQPPAYGSRFSRCTLSSYQSSSSDLKSYDRNESRCLRFRLTFLRYVRLFKPGRQRRSAAELRGHSSFL